MENPAEGKDVPASNQDSSHLNVNRLKGGYLSETSLANKNHAIAALGEFVGTTMFLFLGLGGTNVALQASNSVSGELELASGVSMTNTSNLLYISLCFSTSLAACIFCFFRISSGLFNPAVTFALTLLGGITPTRGAVLSVTQIVAGIAGAALADALTPGPLSAATKLGNGVDITRGFFIETSMTAMLVFTILMVAFEKNRATFISPLIIGLTLFVCEMFGVYYTGGSLNPARSLGPAILSHSFPSYHWIYWIAPLLGATIAAGLYKLLKIMKYETNLGRDCDGDGHTTEYNMIIISRLKNIEAHFQNRVEGGVSVA